MGNYETHELGCTVSLDINDLFDEDEVADMTYEQRKAALTKEVNAWLEEEILPAWNTAAKMSQAKDSILPAPEPEPEKEPPRRTERVTRRSTR